MRLLLTALLFSFGLFYAKPLPANTDITTKDHTLEGAAYELADASYNMFRYARRYYQRLAWFAEAVHQSASELYHAARNQPPLPAKDHTLEQIWQEVQYDYAQLEREWRYNFFYYGQDQYLNYYMHETEHAYGDVARAMNP